MTDEPEMMDQVSDRIAAMGESRGSALVEFAMVLPLMAMFLLGALDFGRFLYEGVSVAGAASAGALYGSFDDVTSLDVAGMEAIAEQEAGNLNGAAATVERFCECPGGSSVACNGTCTGGRPHIYVRVGVEATFAPLFTHVGLPGSFDLEHEAVMRAR